MHKIEYIILTKCREKKYGRLSKLAGGMLMVALVMLIDQHL